MTTSDAIPVSAARQNLAELCNRVAYGGERLLIARRGKGRVALVSAEDLELLQALEDALDLEAARKALREAERTGTKPLEQLVRELELEPDPHKSSESGRPNHSSYQRPPYGPPNLQTMYRIRV